MENILPPRSHTPEMLEVIYQKIIVAIEEHSDNQAIIDQLAISSMIVLTSSVEQAKDLNEHLFFKKYWNTLTGDKSRDFDTVAQHIRLLECVANFVLEELKSRSLIKHHTNIFLSTSFQSISQLASSRHTAGMEQFLEDVTKDLEQVLPTLQQQEFAPALKKWQLGIDKKLLGEVPYTNLNDIEKISYFSNEFLHLFVGQPTSKNIFDAISLLHSLNIPINKTITYSQFFEEIINNNLLMDKLLDGIIIEHAKRFYTPTLPLFKTIRKVMLLRTSQQFLVNGMKKYFKSVNMNLFDEEILLIYANSFLDECGYINPDNTLKLVDLFIELIVEMNILSMGNLSYDEYEELDSSESSVIVDNPYKIGHYIQFGSFENQKITWIIIDIKEDSYTLLAKENLFQAEFSKLKGELGPGLREWRGSTIRKYLNDTIGFLNEFTDVEYDKMLESNTDYLKDKYNFSEDISKYRTAPSSTITATCEDKVFLLSIKEVKELLFNQNLPLTSTEPYFLRDSSYEKQIVHTINPNSTLGKVDFDDTLGIRPAICIKKSIFEFGDGLTENPFRFEA